MDSYKFKLGGGPVRVGFSISQGAVVAVYRFKLYNRDSNYVVWQQPGDNQNTQDDVYELHGGAELQNGRRLMLRTEASNPLAQPQKYTVRLTLSQDGVSKDFTYSSELPAKLPRQPDSFTERMYEGDYEPSDAPRQLSYQLVQLEGE